MSQKVLVGGQQQTKMHRFLPSLHFHLLVRLLISIFDEGLDVFIFKMHLPPKLALRNLSFQSGSPMRTK